MRSSLQTSSLNKAYRAAAETIKTAILQGQYEAAKDVNRVQLATYFGIGKYVSTHTRNGVWGTGALQSISTILQQLLPGLRGYSAESLKLMRKFYEGWRMLDLNGTLEDCNSVIAITELENAHAAEPTLTSSFPHDNSEVKIDDLKIGDGINVFHSLQFPDVANFPIEDFLKVPFTHHTRILSAAKSLDERFYYIHRCSEEHMSVSQLVKAIGNKDYQHRDSIPNNFYATLSKEKQARKAVMAFKDEYLLNFINVEEIGERDEEDIDERVVEQQIVHNVKKFIMTFGHDFAFIGNQYRLEIYGVEHFPDLVFFNRELNALVIVELNTGKFKPSYLGQLNAYLAIADDHLRKPHENATIGIVLCKSANKNYAEYMVRQYDKPMGVATYKTSSEMPTQLRNALPDIEDLKNLL